MNPDGSDIEKTIYKPRQIIKAPTSHLISIDKPQTTLTKRALKKIERLKDKGLIR